jgi:hypothetical protein
MRRTRRKRRGSIFSIVFVPNPSTHRAPPPATRPHGCRPTLSRRTTRFVAGSTFAIVFER